MMIDGKWNEFVESINQLNHAGLHHKFIAKDLGVKVKDIVDWRDGKNLPDAKRQKVLKEKADRNSFWNEM